MKFLKANTLSLIALLLMILSSLMLWGSLPEEIPVQFDFDGTLVDTGNKTVVAVLLPVIFLATIAAINVLIRISPRKFSMPNSKRAMDIIVFGLGVMLLFLHLGLLLNEGNYSIFQRYFALGMAAFLIITGNVAGKTERNFIIGIRLPWTIASSANWRATHRLAGTLMVVSGFILALISIVYSSALLTLLLCLVPILVPIAYSPLYYWRVEHNHSGE